ncbi:hypothetical protein HDU86_007977 [Geranomyces michiganensis]|nr:hypothetical protein HDU86_007977 [Geranomyces michiganensis]
MCLDEGSGELDVRLPVSRPDTRLNFCLAALSFQKVVHHKDKWMVTIPLKPCEASWDKFNIGAELETFVTGKLAKLASIESKITGVINEDPGIQEQRSKIAKLTKEFAILRNHYFEERTGDLTWEE